MSKTRITCSYFVKLFIALAVVTHSSISFFFVSIKIHFDKLIDAFNHESLIFNKIHFYLSIISHRICYVTKHLFSPLQFWKFFYFFFYYFDRCLDIFRNVFFHINTLNIDPFHFIKSHYGRCKKSLIYQYNF